jgi:hypothetical protein
MTSALARKKTAWQHVGMREEATQRRQHPTKWNIDVVP